MQPAYSTPLDVSTLSDLSTWNFNLKLGNKNLLTPHIDNDNPQTSGGIMVFAYIIKTSVISYGYSNY